MTLDATFWVTISFFIFIGILFYVALNITLTLLVYAFPENPPYFVRQILNNFSALTGYAWVQVYVRIPYRSGNVFDWTGRAAGLESAETDGGCFWHACCGLIK